MSVNRPLNSSSMVRAGDIEREVAERAVVVLPAAMLLLQIVVAERFNRLAKRRFGGERCHFPTRPGGASRTSCGMSTCVSPAHAVTDSIWPLSPSPSNSTVTAVTPAAAKASKTTALLRSLAWARDLAWLFVLGHEVLSVDHGGISPFCGSRRPPARPRFRRTRAGGRSDGATQNFVYARGMPPIT